MKIGDKEIKEGQPLYYFDPWTERIERAYEYKVECIAEGFGGDRPEGFHVLVRNPFGWLALNTNALFQNEKDAKEHYKRVIAKL